MSERERLLRRIAALDFALVDIQIFLDTHPNDAEALAKLDEYEQKARALREEFERNYGPIKSINAEPNRWAWIANPWPWDNQEG